MSEIRRSSKQLPHIKKLLAEALQHEVDLLANYEAVRKMRSELEAEIIYIEGHKRRTDAKKAAKTFLKEARETLQNTTD